MKINEKFKKKHRKEKIVQFGEGVFLRGFADVFFQMLNDENLIEAGVVLVKPRKSAKPGMFDKLKEQDGMYTHIERGIKDKNKTVVIISHRMTFASIADRVFVIKDGAVAEQGTPKQLLNAKGLFYEYFNTQRSLYF